MNPVFLDTVGLIAIWDEADQWQSLAMPVFLQLLSEKRELVTTPWVLLECGNAAARRTYRSDVCDLRQKLIENQCLIEPTAEEIEGAWQEYRIGLVSAAGIVDLVSFAVMRRLGITDAFTNDKQFTAAGFKVLF
jgi:predicted nucleic acid-binding protein